MKKNKVIGFVILLFIFISSGIGIYNTIENNKIKEQTIVLKKELKEHNNIKSETETSLDIERDKNKEIEKKESDKNKELENIKQEKQKLEKELSELKGN